MRIKTVEIGKILGTIFAPAHPGLLGVALDYAPESKSSIALKKSLSSYK